MHNQILRNMAENIIEDRRSGGVSYGNWNSTNPSIVTLDLLLVSDDGNFLKQGEELLSKQTTLEGRSSFNVISATKQQLEDQIAHIGEMHNIEKEDVAKLFRIYDTDISLFDLRGELSKGLNLMKRYLHQNPNCFGIASINKSSIVDLLGNPLWKELSARSISDMPFDLTQRYSFIKEHPLGIGGPDLKVYFKGLLEEPLREHNLDIVRGLKAGNYKAMKRAIFQPTPFAEFSRSIREENGLSPLIKRSLDIIADFIFENEPLNTLNQIQPTDPYFVPQHCYPPFSNLRDLSPKETASLIRESLSNQITVPVSLYLHIPYCPGKEPCAFCDYFTVRGVKEGKEYVAALKKELGIFYEKTGLQETIPKGIHIGGGTPSMLPNELIIKIGDILQESFLNYQKETQLTFEVGPNTAKEDKLEIFKDHLGASRVSIGLQSTNENLLSKLQRLFTTDSGQKSIETLLTYFPETTNVDLMYGLPSQTIESWENDLNAMIKLKVPSITCYELRISPRTTFGENEKYPEFFETMLMRIMAVERLTEVGYTQVSDNQFVKSVEEQPYVYRDSKKRGGNTLGIGGSSYSLFPGLIYFNIAGKDPHRKDNLERYFKAIGEGKLPVEIGKKLEEGEQRSLFMIQGLKLYKKNQNGVDLTQFEKRFNQKVETAFPVIITLKNLGLVEERDNYLGLTYKGLSFEPLVLKAFYHR